MSPAVAPGTELSYNWTGFIDSVKAPGNIESLSASWYVPSLSCPNSGLLYGLEWVGLGAGTSKTNLLNQTGTFSFCRAGVAHYFGWWEQAPDNSVQGFECTPMMVCKVDAGDEMYAEVVESPNSHNVLTATMYLEDLTQNWVQSTTGVGKVAPSKQAEVITERPTVNGSLPRLPNFGSVDYFSQRASGTLAGSGSFSTDLVTPTSGVTIKDVTMVNDGPDRNVLATSAVDDGNIVSTWRATGTP